MQRRPTGVTRYTADTSNSAYNAINKTLKANGCKWADENGQETTLYSLRHTMRARLITNGARQDVTDYILGHSDGSAKGFYGSSDQYMPLAAETLREALV